MVGGFAAWVERIRGEGGNYYRLVMSLKEGVIVVISISDIIIKLLCEFVIETTYLIAFYMGDIVRDLWLMKPAVFDWIQIVIK